MNSDQSIPTFSLRPIHGHEPEITDGRRRITLVGRRATCHAVLHSHSVSEVHACLVRRKDGLWLYDMASRNGTRVNDAPVAERRLRSGDRVQFGQVPYEVRIDGPAAGHLEMVIATARDTITGRTYPLSRPVTIVGRRGHSHILIDGDDISRVHALLVRCPSGVVVCDAGSRTGVLVDGQRVREALLTGQQKITIGLTELAVDIDHTPGGVFRPSDPFASVDEILDDAAQSDPGGATPETSRDDLAAPVEETAPGEVAESTAPAAPAVTDDSPWGPPMEGPEMTPEKKPAPPPAPPWHGVLAINPQSLRPARRTTAPAEPEQIERRPVADSAEKRSDDALTRQQQRLAAEVQQLRHQLSAERQAMAAQQKLVEQRLAGREAIEQAQAEHAEALRRMETERGELERLRQQIEVMREGVEVQRNALEVERRSLAETRAAVETDAAQLKDDRAGIAQMMERVAIEQERLRNSQSDLAARQKDLDASRRTIEAELARLNSSSEQLAADRQSIEQQRQEFQRRQDELARQAERLQQDREEAEDHTHRLADVEKSLAERHEQLAATEADILRRADQLAAEQQEHESRVTRFEETAASARAADDIAQRTQQDLDARVDRERAAVDEVAASAPPEPTEAEPATVSETMTDEAPPEQPAAASRYETSSAVDDDFRALMADLDADDGAYAAAGDELRSTAEELEAERAALWGDDRTGRRGRRGWMALLLTSAAAAALVLAAVYVVPLLTQKAPAQDGAPTGDDLAATHQVTTPITPPEPTPPSEKPVEPPSTETAPPIEVPSHETVETPTTETTVASVETPQTTVTETPAPETPVASTETSPTTVSEAPLPVPPPPEPSPETTMPETSTEETTSAETTAGEAQPSEVLTTTEAPPAESPVEPPVAPPVTPAETPSVETPSPAPLAEAIPGGVWAYKAPENLTPVRAEDLKPTLDWARRTLAERIAAVRRAYGMPEDAGPRQAIVVQLSERLTTSLRAYVPPPYLAEKVAGADGTQRDEDVTSLVFLEFVYEGKPYLFVMKRREGAGEVVAGRQGSFVLVPGTIQEHTVVLDPTRKAVPEPLMP